MKLVVMGVSGCGKSSVGELLAQKIGAVFIDGDDLHPASNKEKMSSGIPLNDDDRLPWLQSVGKTLQGQENIVVACSALKKSYRDKILAQAPTTRFIHLHGSKELLLGRLGYRTSHFMPLSLLDSQLQTLEMMDSSEPGKVFDVAKPVGEIIEEVIIWIDSQW
jgi:carbohydrate kinase (thermoresistant glucokinase family)